MKTFNKQLGITLVDAFLVTVLVTGFAFAGMVLMTGLGITTYFLIS